MVLLKVPRRSSRANLCALAFQPHDIQRNSCELLWRRLHARIFKLNAATDITSTVASAMRAALKALTPSLLLSSCSTSSWTLCEHRAHGLGNDIRDVVGTHLSATAGWLVFVTKQSLRRVTGWLVCRTNQLQCSTDCLS